MIRIHVLTDDREFAYARTGQPFGFAHDICHGPRYFRAARIGHYAEGTELVAAFLHGQERRDAAAGDLLAAGRGERAEFFVNRGLRVEQPFARFRTREHLRQSVVVLRADDYVHDTCPADDLPAFRLRNAARHRDYHLATIGGRLVLHDPQPTDFGIDLLRRLLADVAGVQDDEIGAFRRGGFHIAAGRQGIRHTMGIVDVHLAAERFDMDFPRVAHVSLSVGPAALHIPD